MVLKKKNSKQIAFSTFLLIILILSIIFQVPGLQKNITDSMKNGSTYTEQDFLQASETDYYSEEWIQYGNFSSGADSWWYTDIDGDLSDVELLISGDEANYIITGEQFVKKFDDPINTSTASNWVAFNKTEPAMNPDKYTTNDGGLLRGVYFIDDDGFFMNHTWHDDTPDQFVSISWRYNASMGVDMSDYTITSALFDAIMYATVDWNVDTQYCTYAQGTNLINQGGIFDHAFFTIEIATMDLSNIYKIGYNQTNDLGRDDTSYYTIEDKSIEQVGDEQDLIYYLTSLLDRDPGHDEFAIIVTIEIQCEDDYTSRDYDDWEELRVKSLNLTMAYEKNIDRLTKLSWNQDANKIPSNYEIDNATLNFKYASDNNWIANTGSVNSEFRIIINNNQLGETVKLSTSTTLYQDFKVGGLDVSNFLSADEEVNVTIQIYIADEFTLDSDITISIDNVSLIIDYGIFTPPDTTSYNLFLNDVNRTTEKSTQVTFNENLNITLVYKDSLGDFIPGANVELTGSGLPPITLSQGSFDNYYTIINSTNLGVGTSYLTLTASKRYFTTQQFQITVEVITRDTEIQLFLDMNNRTIEKEWTTEWNENLNITIRYRDIENAPSTHISEATVELTGVGPTKTLIEDLANEQYEILINTSDIGVGSKFLTLYASKENYTSLNIRFKITVTSRTTYLDNLELDGIESNSIIIAWNELFDITVSYNDTITDNFIDGASLQLIGTVYSKLFSQSGQLYNLTVNTYDLPIGNNFLTLLAQKDNYSVESELITITVIERATTVESILNHTSATAINFPHGELLNITAIYNDLAGPFIDDAIVELREGSTVIYTLTKSLTFDQYSVVINTTELNLGVNLLTLYAKKDNYSAAFVSITLTIDERDTSIEIYLEETPTTVIEKPYNEYINITIVYKDFSDAFIVGATCELREGGTTLYTFSTHPTFTQYNLTINTKNLDLGTNLLAIYANKENYSAALVSITIIVGERDTSLEIYLEDMPTTAIERAYDESINITVIYKDFANYFIDGATVELRQGENTLYTIPKHLTFDQYNLTINTKNLNLGTNLLAIYANKDNYSAALASITIIVGERDTSLEIYLEETPTTAIERAYDESINITVIYRDFTNASIDGATVELRQGETTLYIIPKHLTFDQYSLIINTKNLNLGTKLLAIHANKDNYSAALASITIIVRERDTVLDVYLEEAQTTAIEIAYGELVNITVVYEDLTGPFIDGATVELRNSTTVLDNFSKHLTFNQYYLTKNTTELKLGSNVFSIYAKKENYTVALVSILITVTERDTTLIIYLEETQTMSIEVIYGELFNITAIYEDFTSTFIDGATVELRDGTTTLDTFSKHATFEQYFLIKNSNEFSLGGNVLSIYAKKENYTVSLVSILITVNERDTTLDVLLNGVDSSTIEFFSISINDVLNITAIYEDITPIFIPGATVELTGLGISETLTLHPTFNQYNYTLNPEVLGVGVHFLVISADKENYTSSIKNIKLNVLERGSNLELYIDGDNLTSSRYIAAEIDQTLNVTVYFTDSSDYSFVSNANLKLTGALNDNLTENAILQHYNISIRTIDLNQGINFLTIFAQKQGYVSQSILFTIEVKEKASNLQLFLNGNNETLGKSIEVIVGELINVTVIYEDYAKLFIDNAEVIIVGEGIDSNLTKHSTYNQYNVTIDSDDLNFGINLLTLYAKRANYQPQTLIVRIEIIVKETDLQIFLNGLNKTIDRTLTLPLRKLLNVTVKYLEFDTGVGISGAIIQLVGEGLSLNLTENPLLQHYSISVDTTQLDIGVRFLTIFAQRSNYQSSSALLRIQVDRIRTNITTVSGETVINRQPGENCLLEIKLLDLDFNTDILNATVTYTWTYGQGTLTDPENDGIYEGTISNLREGTFVITISVYAGDDYEFERFTVTLNVVQPPEDVLLFQILTILGIGAAVGLGGYLFAYQRVFKYPKQVRKIRKYKSKLKKLKSLGLEIRSRDQLIEDNYAEKIHPLEKQLKSKITPKAGKDAIQKETFEQSENNQNNINT